MAEDREARLEQRVVALFYLFLRDLMPVGALTEYVERISQEERRIELTSKPLESVARDLVERLSRPAGQPAWSKATQDFMEKLPTRTRTSPHFEAVMGELDGAAMLDDRTRAAVIAEVAKREQAAARR